MEREYVEISGRSSDSGQSTASSDSGMSARPQISYLSSARPQVVNGREIWPEYWGMSRAQIRELLERLRRDPAWNSQNNVYTLVGDFIVPWTAGHGHGYALLLNSEKPLQVNMMISHAFSENAEEFLETVARAISDHDVVYICALANYQANDDCGPSVQQQIGSELSQSPFRRVLEHISRQDMAKKFDSRWYLTLRRLPSILLCVALCIACCLPLADGHAFIDEDFQCCFRDHPWIRTAWAWCLTLGLALVGVALRLHLWVLRRPRASMIVVPNRNEDIYRRLWCVYEMFVALTLHVRVELAPSMAAAGRISSRHATCTLSEDTARIRAEIGPIGYDHVDKQIRRTLRSTQWHAVGLYGKYVFLLSLPACVFDSIKMNTSTDPNYGRAAVYTFNVVAYGVYTGVLYIVVKRNQGVFRINLRILQLAVLVGFATVLEGFLSLLVWQCVISVGWSKMTFILLTCPTEAILCELLVIGLFISASHCNLFPPSFHQKYRIGVLFGYLVCLVVMTTLGLYARVIMDSDYWSFNEYMLAWSLLAIWLEFMPFYMVWTEFANLGLKFDKVEPHTWVWNLTAWAGLLTFLVVILQMTFLQQPLLMAMGWQEMDGRLYREPGRICMYSSG